MYWNWGADRLLLPHKTFLKKKERSGTSLAGSQAPQSPIFSTFFQEKYFVCYILLTLRRLDEREGETRFFDF